MLRVNSIIYKAGGRKLLDNISLELHPGRLNFIIGPNGAGKSTLVKIISNQLIPLSGNISLGDRDLKTYTLHDLARIRAVLSQNIGLAFPLSVSEVVMMGRYPHFKGSPGAKDLAACEEAMEFFDVGTMRDRNYLSLSGGEKQRVQFARVMAQIWHPVQEGYRCLILDEPLASLDVHYQIRFLEKLKALLCHKDLIIAGVIHDLNLAAKYADYIVLLNNGVVLAEGSRETVLTAGYINTAYHLSPVVRYEDGAMYLFF